MNINIKHDEEKTMIALLGRLDTTTSPKLQEILIPEINGTMYVELDFAKLTYISSAGLRVLLMGEKTAKAKGSRQTIINISPDVMEVFEITGFSSVLNLE